MERRQFGKTDMQVSLLGFGGAEIGFEGSNEETVARLLKGALDAGLNVIDTGECYEGSEELIGKTVAERRADYYLFTKCGHAARYAVECGAFDSLQTSINIADQEALDLLLPLAREKKLGVIAKRPVANVAWKESHKPINSYHHAYWERLNKLRYDFIRDLPLEDSVAHALRFTLSVPGVHTAIVGTTKPERWQENAKLVEKGKLSDAEFGAIRERWEEIAPAGWVGQT